MGHILLVAAFVIPLSLDTFALSAALGAAGLPAGERLRTGLILTAFEGGMPIVGFLLGSGIGRAIGSSSDYVAAGILAVAGLYILWPRDEDEEEQARRLQRARGAAILALGLGISLDELAIGFGGGLLRLPLLVLAALIAAQAFVAAQLGMRVGSRIDDDAREWAERVAGALLILAAALVLLERQAGW